METNIEQNSTSLPGNRSILVPHRIALIIMWIVTTVVTIILLTQNVRETDQFQIIRYVLQATYVLTLLWFLWITDLSDKKLPEQKSVILPKTSSGKYIPAIIILLLFVLSFISDDVISLLMLLMIFATLLILILMWREIKLKIVIQGIAVALLAFIPGYLILVNDYGSESVVYFLPGLVPFMYVAGCLLIKRSGLGRIQLVEGKFRKTGKSFLLGCLLFIPLGLFNAAEGSPGGNLDWVDQWWMPSILPLFSGIAEETWFRLLLVSLVFFLLRPAFRKQPAMAVIAAVLFSAIIFGLSHGRNLDRFFTTGLLYGLPLAVVFVRRDWEHSVGAHYMINMIPWTMAFIESL